MGPGRQGLGNDLLVDASSNKISRVTAQFCGTTHLLASIMGGGEKVLLVLVVGVPVGIGMVIWAARREVQLPDGAVPAAGVGLRYLAKIIDLVVVLVPAFLIAAADKTAGGFAIIFGWLLYNWLMVAIWGSTLGKLMVGVAVVDKDDRRFGWGGALGRALWEYSYVLPLIWLVSVISLGISKASRSPLDYTVGSRVVKRASVRHLFA
jgi:uncharacterized RDD family membrane protein YckC